MPHGVPLLPNVEVFDDTWEFEAGDAVPAWLAYTRGLKTLSFVARTTVFADLDGRFWIMPHEVVDQTFHCLGYGVGVYASVVCLGTAPAMILCEPLVRAEALRRAD